MEILADKIEHFLNQQMILYSSLDSIFEEEKKQLIELNVDGLWGTVAQKKNIIQLLSKMNLDMKKLLEMEADLLGEDKESFNLSELIGKMPSPVSVKNHLRKIKKNVETFKNKVNAIALSNKKYVQESLVVIDDIFSIATRPDNDRNYSYMGQMVDSGNSNHLISTEG
jgi:hypothetical protein